MDYNIGITSASVSKALAQRLRAIRRSKKYSQAELSDRSGVSLGSLKRFESTGKISLSSLLKLMAIFDRLHEFDTILLPDEDVGKLDKLFSDKTRRQ